MRYIPPHVRRTRNVYTISDVLLAVLLLAVIAWWLP